MILISLDIKVLAYLTKLLKRAIRSLPLGMIIFIKPNAGCMTLPSVLVPLMLFRCSLYPIAEKLSYHGREHNL